MIIVSDTSAITSLIQIERAEMLRQLYEEVVIPEQVANELRRFHSSLPPFLKIKPVTDQSCFQRLRAEVDAGEAAAITLVLQGTGDLLLIDERRGREIARREGVAVVGLLGVLLEARLRGIIPSLATVIAELESVAEFRLSSELKARALRAAGESKSE